MIRKHGKASLAAALALATMLAGCATSGPEDTAATATTADGSAGLVDDGLRQVDHKGFDAVYWRDGASLADYDRVLIDNVEVSFRKNWQRDQNRQRRSPSERITAEDMARIRAAVAEGFTEVLVQELEAAGYPVVDAPGENVLTLEPAIVDLDVRAPDVSMRQPGITRTYTTEAGRMTLNLELYDSGTNSLIGRVVDRRLARNTGMLQFSNQITNRQEANVIFRSWARVLVRALNEAESGQ